MDSKSDSQLAARAYMVEHQIRARGVSDERVLAVMAEVPREAFCPENLRHRAFEDRPLPIGEGQTISQPYTVAFMTELLQLEPSDNVLEVGTGSGYAAAVLSHLVRHVDTVERIPALAIRASQQLKSLGCDNVSVHVDDGSRGLPACAPFDAILVTAAAPDLPQPYVEQLRDGGRIVIPIGNAHQQRMCRFTKRNNALDREDFGTFMFVPLVGEHGVAE